jgi:hypothetical protein
MNELRMTKQSFGRIDAFSRIHKTARTLADSGRGGERKSREEFDKSS